MLLEDGLTFFFCFDGCCCCCCCCYSQTNLLSWEVELRHRLLWRPLFTFGSFVEARRPLWKKTQAPSGVEHFDPRNLRGKNVSLVKLRVKCT